jgi:hypothetical protein
MTGRPVDLVVDSKARRVADDVRVGKLAANVAECVQAGAVSRSGMGAEAREYVSDGVARWHDRGVAGAVLRWKRPAVNDAEALDLAALLVGVPDDCDGWLVMEDVA